MRGWQGGQEGGKMDENKFREIIQYAIAKEIEAIDFYNRANKVAKYRGVKKLLLEIAQEEEAHRKLLENLIIEGINQSRIAPIRDLKISDYLIEIDLKPIMSYMAILKIGIKMEEQFIKLYNDLKESITDEKIRDLLTRLVQEEEKHRLKFDKELFSK